MRFTTSYKVGVGRVLGTDVNVPEQFDCAFEFEEDHSVHLAIAFDEKGRPSCDEIRIVRNPAKPSLSGDELRRLPLADWVPYACTQVGLIRGDDGAWRKPQGAREARVIERAVTRRRVITDELLIEVASIADQHGAYAAEEIADQFECSTATAYRWLKAAKKRGFHNPKET